MNWWRANRSGNRWAILGVCCVLLGLSGACRRRSATPQDAFRRFQDAVGAQDAAALFDAMEQGSRWAWMTVQKSHREAYDIILSNYPEGQERERELRRFQKGAMTGSARELFFEELGKAALAKFPRPMPTPTRFDPPPSGAADERIAVLADGTQVPFRKGPDGGWGLSLFSAESEVRQNRALHDVDMVRASAADYERAAARGAR